jgi:ethanolamine ammonia-lyase small subunit
VTDAPPPENAPGSGSPAVPTLSAGARTPGRVVADPWSSLRVHTPSNVAIGRVGHSLPTSEVLRFGLAHTQARDAVHTALDVDRLSADLTAAGWANLNVHSAADTRHTYLCRPDLGRRLSACSTERLAALAGQAERPPDLCLVIGDGLSSVAVQAHAVPLLGALRARLRGSVIDSEDPRAISPVVIATQARVALADEIAQRLRARMVVMLIGERPGLSSPDSLGVYATWAPCVGRTDAERNCISNIRAEGLSYPAAAFRLGWLIEQAFERRVTGVELKDESGRVALNLPTQVPAGG